MIFTKYMIDLIRHYIELDRIYTTNDLRDIQEMLCTHLPLLHHVRIKNITSYKNKNGRLEIYGKDLLDFANRMEKKQNG